MRFVSVEFVEMWSANAPNDASFSRPRQIIGSTLKVAEEYGLI